MKAADRVLRMCQALALRLRPRGKRRPQAEAINVWVRSGRSRSHAGDPTLEQLSDHELLKAALGVAKHRSRGLSERDHAVQREWAWARALPWWLVQALGAVSRATPAEQAILAIARAGETAKRLVGLVLAAHRRGYNGVALSCTQAVAAGVATSRASWWRAVEWLQAAGVLARTLTWKDPRNNRSGAPVDRDRNHYALQAAAGALVGMTKGETAKAARKPFLAALAKPQAKLDADPAECERGVGAWVAREDEAARVALDRAIASHGETRYCFAEEPREKEGSHSTPRPGERGALASRASELTPSERVLAGLWRFPSTCQAPDEQHSPPPAPACAAPGGRAAASASCAQPLTPERLWLRVVSTADYVATEIASTTEAVLESLGFSRKATLPPDAERQLLRLLEAGA